MSPPKFPLWIAAAGCLAACVSQNEAPLAPPEPTILLTVERQCGSCHTPSHPDAMTEAIAIFDLEDPDWLSGIPWEVFERVFMPRILPWIPMDTSEAVYGAIAVDLARRRGGE